MSAAVSTLRCSGGLVRSLLQVVQCWPPQAGTQPDGLQAEPQGGGRGAAVTVNGQAQSHLDFSTQCGRAGQRSSQTDGAQDAHNLGYHNECV